LSAAAAAHMIGGRRLSDDGTGWFQLPLPVASRAPAGLYRWCSLPCCLPPASSASRYSVCRGSEMDGGQEPEEMRNLPVLVLLGFTLGFIRLRCAARCLAQVRLRDYVYISVPPTNLSLAMLVPGGTRTSELPLLSCVYPIRVFSSACGIVVS
jgi:hypothetical protein